MSLLSSLYNNPRILSMGNVSFEVYNFFVSMDSNLMITVRLNYIFKA